MVPSEDQATTSHRESWTVDDAQLGSSSLEGTSRKARMPCTVEIDIHTHFCSSTVYPVKTTTGECVVDAGEKKFGDFETLYVRIKAQYEMIPKLPEKKVINEEQRTKAQRTNHIRRKLEEWLNELLSRNDVAADESLCSFLGIQPEDAVAGIGGFKDAPAKPWYVEHLEDNGVVPRTRNSLGGPRRSNSGNRQRLLNTDSTPSSPNTLLSCQATPVLPRPRSLGTYTASSDPHGANPHQWGVSDRVSISPNAGASSRSQSSGHLGADDGMPQQTKTVMSKRSMSCNDTAHGGQKQKGADDEDHLRRCQSDGSGEPDEWAKYSPNGHEQGLHMLKESKDMKGEHKRSVVALASAMAMQNISKEGSRLNNISLGEQGLLNSVGLGEQGFIGEGLYRAAGGDAGERLGSKSNSMELRGRFGRKGKSHSSPGSHSAPDGSLLADKQSRAREKREAGEYMSRQAQRGRIETTGM